MDENDRTFLVGKISTALAGVEVDSYEAEQRLVQLALSDQEIPVLATKYLADVSPPLEDDDATTIGAYIIAHSWNRRHGNQEECEVLDKRMIVLEGKQGRFPILQHFMAMTSVMGTQSEVRAAVGMASRAAQSLPTNPGVLHSLASTYLRRSEFEDLTDDELAAAELAVTTAIQWEPNKARFHYSLARIYKLQKKFKEALDSLARAVKLEDSTSDDYQLRLAEYKIETAAVVIEKRLDEKVTHTTAQVAQLESELSAARTSLEGAQLRQVETLAIFTAMLGLLTMSANALGGFKLWEACVLIVVVGVVLIGAVFVAHAMMDIRFTNRNRTRT